MTAEDLEFAKIDLALDHQQARDEWLGKKSDCLATVTARGMLPHGMYQLAKARMAHGHTVYGDLPPVAQLGREFREEIADAACYIAMRMAQGERVGLRLLLSAWLLGRVWRLAGRWE